MKRTHRSALILALAAAGATLAQPTAAAEATAEGPDPAIHVMNNYGAMVRVYLEDAEGRLHRIGRVAQGQLGAFELPEHLMGGSFRIRIQPAQPVWALQQDDFGVKTSLIDPGVDSHVTVWVEPDLTKSVVDLARG